MGVGCQRHASSVSPRNDQALIVQETRSAPGPVWTEAENLALTGIRSPDRPAHNESLYRLSYPGRRVIICVHWIDITEVPVNQDGLVTDGV